MNDAYSNLLGEFVTAEEVGHDDVSGFQIVCPCCRDPIFKVERDQDFSRSHYFSHFQRGRLDTDLCERRVLGMSRSLMNDESERSRRDNLKMYKAVLRDALSLIPIGGDVIGLRTDIGGSIPDKVRAWIAETVSLMTDEQLRGFVSQNDQLIEDLGYPVGTSFSSRVRSRIVADLLRTLVREKAETTLKYMVGRGMRSTITPKSDDPKTMTTSGRASKLHQALATDPDFPGGATSMAYCVMDACLRELHRLPYFKMIENVKSQRPPLWGISFADYIPDRDMEYESLHERPNLFDGPRTTNSSKGMQF